MRSNFTSKTSNVLIQSHVYCFGLETTFAASDQYPTMFSTMSSVSAIEGRFSGRRPSFDALPLRQGDPKASAWGLWGDDDELGSLNLLEPSIVRAAAAEVMTGEAVALK